MTNSPQTDPPRSPDSASWVELIDGPAAREFIAAFPRRLLTLTLLIIGSLATLHAVITWAPAGTFHPLMMRFVDLDYESNLPTWFSSFEWMVLALVCAANAVVLHCRARARVTVGVWSLLACGATFLSVDEVAVLHERLGTILEEAARAAPAGSTLHALLGFPSYYWILAYLPIAIPAAVFLIGFMWRELGPDRRIATLSVFVFFYAAIGLDAIEGHFGNSAGDRLPLQIGDRVYAFDIFQLEETLEMLGVALCTYALTCYLLRQFVGEPIRATRSAPVVALNFVDEARAIRRAGEIS